MCLVPTPGPWEGGLCQEMDVGRTPHTHTHTHTGVAWPPLCTTAPWPHTLAVFPLSRLSLSVDEGRECAAGALPRPAFPWASDSRPLLLGCAGCLSSPYFPLQARMDISRVLVVREDKAHGTCLGLSDMKPLLQRGLIHCTKGKGLA